MSDTYVLVHGAWHTGAALEAVADVIRASGHTVHCPTLAGNRPGDDRGRVRLADAIDSLVGYLDASGLQNVRLVAHSYGGMVISGAIHRVLPRIARLVYVNAFVPLDGESLNDLVPPYLIQAFADIAAVNDDSLMLPFPVWREAFINDADLALATSSYGRLNPQPYKTFTDKAVLPQPLAALSIGKSYVNCRQDTAMPHSHPWHPRLSERLGQFRYIESEGSHEAWFTQPAALGQAIIAAARD